MVKRIPNKTFTVQCIGRRHMEIRRTEEGNLEVTIVLMRRGGRQELAHLLVAEQEQEGFLDTLKTLI